MKTTVQPRGHKTLIPQAGGLALRQGPRFAACRHFLALALVVGYSLAAQAQTTATATATVISGAVVVYTVTDGGSGYTEPPVVTVVGGGGRGAAAEALVANGAVTQINPVSGGSGYTNPPELNISAPVADPTVLALQMVPLVTLHGMPGDTNQIETATSLDTGAVWIPLTTIVLTNSVQEWYDRISPPGAGRFYRAVVLGAGSRPTPGLRFVWLSAGHFVMGSLTNEVDRMSDEGPQTQVTLTRGFFLGRYEVTQGEYVSVIGSNPSWFTGDDSRPVEKVSWDDATNYCVQLTARELAAGRLPVGWAYRLPTEAEWEYAALAGSTNRFSYGDDPDYTQLANYAWYAPISASTTHTVGGKLPNQWGLYDMSGNVDEWCSDWYHGAYPGGSVSDPRGPSSGSLRVVRGGDWSYSAWYCRSRIRASLDPASKFSEYGFRVVLAPVQP
jgi:formylglycine-generating enzyme required for sulfatase activity